MVSAVSLGRTVVRQPSRLAGRVSRPWSVQLVGTVPPCYARSLQQQASDQKKVADFAFVFDIDGVLLRSATPIPRARDALTFLQSHRIPFLLLTNGGGQSEIDRVAELSAKLSVPLDTGNFVQSHTPFAALDRHKGDPSRPQDVILVLGGEDGGDVCRRVAEGYGFRHVVTPGDLYTAHPDLWPFSRHLRAYYAAHARPLPAPVYRGAHARHPEREPALDAHLRVAAILVFNDPRDWGLDLTLVTDLLLSHRGYLGTVSARNGDAGRPNRGYQGDGQPTVYFSNPDLWWAALWHTPRLGQGAFREAVAGVWREITGGEAAGVTFRREVWGKPTHRTYEFAERMLGGWRARVLGSGMGEGLKGLKNVYMIGDNPESDIRGANNYQSEHGVQWSSLLVKTGVYVDGTEPAHKPTAIVDDAYSAVQWGLKHSGWEP